MSQTKQDVDQKDYMKNKQDKTWSDVAMIYKHSDQKSRDQQEDRRKEYC